MLACWSTLLSLNFLGILVLILIYPESKFSVLIYVIYVESFPYLFSQFLNTEKSHIATAG